MLKAIRTRIFRRPLRRLILGALRRAREAIYKGTLVRIYHVRLDAAMPIGEAPHPGKIEYREITLAQWPLLEEALIAAHDGTDVEQVRQWLGQGHRAFCAIQNGRVVHYSHVCGAIRHLSSAPVSVELEPTERFLYNGCTLPEARRQGIFKHVLRQILNKLGKEGVTDAYADVNAANIPSIKGIEAVGFRLLYTFRSRRILGISFPLRRSSINAASLHRARNTESAFVNGSRE